MRGSVKSIRVKCPAKINLNLKITGKREDGFHNIESVMQTICLYDTLVVSVEDSIDSEIILSGNSKDIPYNTSNLVYKAAKLFLDNIPPQNKKIMIYIDKNIPISAGLAGGSTDAAGTIFALNNLFSHPLTQKEMHNLCAQLGSDLNVCLEGGRILAKGRGEIIEKQQFQPLKLNLIKPNNLGISAKEAYLAFASKITQDSNIDNRIYFKNDLEWAILDKYPELLYIKEKYPSAIMTGSGSTYFSLTEEFHEEDGFWVKNGISATEYGVQIIS